MYFFILNIGQDMLRDTFFFYTLALVYIYIFKPMYYSSFIEKILKKKKLDLEEPTRVQLKLHYSTQSWLIIASYSLLQILKRNNCSDLLHKVVADEEHNWSKVNTWKAKAKPINDGRDFSLS